MFVIIIVLILILLKPVLVGPINVVLGGSSSGYEAIARKALEAWFDGDQTKLESLHPPDVRGQYSFGIDLNQCAAKGYATDSTSSCYGFGLKPEIVIRDVLSDDVDYYVEGRYATKRVTFVIQANGGQITPQALLGQVSGRWYLLSFEPRMAGQRIGGTN